MLGYGAVSQYRQIRQDAVQSRRQALHSRQLNETTFRHPLLERFSPGEKNIDIFHDGEKVLSEITAWHDLLRASARRTDNITPKILDVVDSMMLIGRPETRKEAKDVCVALDNVISSYTSINLPSQTNGIVKKLQKLDSMQPPPRSKERVSAEAQDGVPVSMTPETMKVSQRSEPISSDGSQSADALTSVQDAFTPDQFQNHWGNVISAAG